LVVAHNLEHKIPVLRNHVSVVQQISELPDLAVAIRECLHPPRA
jgi:hypothetical protein